MTNREFLTLFHGMFLGFLFLLAFAGGLGDSTGSSSCGQRTANSEGDLAG